MFIQIFIKDIIPFLTKNNNDVHQKLIFNLIQELINKQFLYQTTIIIQIYQLVFEKFSNKFSLKVICHFFFII